MSHYNDKWISINYIDMNANEYNMYLIYLQL